MAKSPSLQTIEVPIRGMCCADEAQQVQRAIVALPGVESCEVLLAAEKAVLRCDPTRVTPEAIQEAVRLTGCSVPIATERSHGSRAGGFPRAVLSLFGAVFAVVLLVVVLGERLGLLDAVTNLVPWPVWLTLVLAGGYPVFRSVLSAALRRQVTAHTLMTTGVIAAATVLVVACSCTFAIATPVAMLASIGNAARRGLVIKGGKYVEALARADVLLLDKTGTLTLGRPRITDVVSLNSAGQDKVLSLAASAERYSEHPLAEAVRVLASERGLRVLEPDEFQAVPGVGVKAKVNGRWVTVGRRPAETQATVAKIATLEAQGKALLFVARDGDPLGVLAAVDTLRPEVPEAIASLRALGLTHIELLTGDHERAAASLATPLGIVYRAGLLPEDKIAVVKAYQARGHRVVMMGDGVNDAPALAQADVGVAMGAAGIYIAMEAAHIVLMRDDWRLVPDLFRIARHTMGVVRLNIAFTAAYNLVGLSLAAFGFLPLVLAAAAQSLPDLVIMANSSRLLRTDHKTRAPAAGVAGHHHGTNGQGDTLGGLSGRCKAR